MNALLTTLLFCLAASIVRADAPGAPGIPHAWAPAAKQAVGTALGAQSPVWFTVAEGILTEVFYPSVDQPQNGDLQILVTDGERFFSEQKRDAEARVEYSLNGKGAAVHLSGSDRSGAYSYTQEIVTDPDAPVVRIRTRLVPHRSGLRVYLLWKPTIAGTGADDRVIASTDGLLATQTARSTLGRNAEPVSAALLTSLPFIAMSAGYVGMSDGWQDLSKNFRLTQSEPSAGPGNVALTAELKLDARATAWTWDTALAYAPTSRQAWDAARASLQKPHARVAQQYESGWARWLEGLNPSVRARTASARSALVIKMHEDRRRPGAIVASLSKPGIPDSNRAPDANLGGYHLVWPRDLYHAAMGLLAAGDRHTPLDVLHYLASVQLASGAWSQNFWTDGTPYWSGLQLDEVALPILLAHQLKKHRLTSLTEPELRLVRKAADFIMTHGPVTQQERWEEIGGYVPNTLATEIAALRAAAGILSDVSYAQRADAWDRKLEDWTVVPRGPWGEGYYLRVSPSGRPDRHERIEIANGGGGADAWDILDGGFLDLARLGVRRFDSSAIFSTLQIYESERLGISARVGVGTARAYRRYNRDAYGHGRIGGYWPLLAGERGHFAVLAGDLTRAREQLMALERSAIRSGLLPEQTIDAIDTVSPGSARPLVWAHAEALRLERSIAENRVFDAP